MSKWKDWYWNKGGRAKVLASRKRKRIPSYRDRTFLKVRVFRKDGSIRDCVIMKDESTSRMWYRFVNLTTNHICRCRFGSIRAAVNDLEQDPFVERYEVLS